MVPGIGMASREGSGYNVRMSGPDRVQFGQSPPIAVAMAGVDVDATGLGRIAPGGERVREVIGWLAKAGARGVRVDATAAGIRPRELDRSGRRDLSALLRRSELAFAGVDFFIPPEHFGKPDMADRAVSGVLAAVDLAADLAGLAGGSVVTRSASGSQASVSIVLPEKLAPDMRRSLSDHAQSRGVRLSDQAWPIGDAGDGGREGESIGIGLDPAVALSAGGDPVMLAAKLGARLVCARLSDVGAGALGGGRVLPGSGRLDVAGYLATLSTIGYAGHVVLDLQGLRDPAGAVAEVARP